MSKGKWIDNNGAKENRPEHNQICLTKSLFGISQKVCVWNEQKEAFNPIEDGEIKRDVNLRDSARFWKPITSIF